MSLEQSILNLADAINKLASAQMAEVEQTAKLIVAPEDQADPVEPVIEEPPAPSPKKKAAKKKAVKKTAPAPEPVVDEVEEARKVVEGVDEEVIPDSTVVQARLREIASQLTDTTQLFELISKRGASQFSELPATEYNGLLKEAEALIDG